MEPIKYTKIGQFRHMVKEALLTADSVGHKLKFDGTVKIHGSNGSIVIRPDETLIFQSRNIILTVDNDNHGFAKEMSKIGDFWNKFGNCLRQSFIADATYIVYGEWAGNGIQGGVGVSKLRKQFYVFDIKLVQEGYTDRYLSSWNSSDSLISLFSKPKADNYKSDIPVYNINDFAKFAIEVDVFNPELSIKTMEEIVKKVEDNCPVSAAFGLIDEIGEGIVYKSSGPVEDKEGQVYNYRFKTKGDKHSRSKVKKLPKISLSPEEYKIRDDFVVAVLHNERMMQGISYLEEMGLPLEMSSFGGFIKWVISDVVAEEADVMEVSGIEKKDIGKILPNKIKQWYIKEFNK